MSELLVAYPGAQRALFRKYHVGGCSSCGFAPTESLAQIAARNPHMDLAEVCAFLETSREEDRAMEITPQALQAAMRDGTPAPLRLLDIRTREEYEAVAHCRRRVVLAAADEHDSNGMAARRRPDGVDRSPRNTQPRRGCLFHRPRLHERTRAERRHRRVEPGSRPKARALSGRMTRRGFRQNDSIL